MQPQPPYQRSGASRVLAHASASGGLRNIGLYAGSATNTWRPDAWEHAALGNHPSAGAGEADMSHVVAPPHLAPAYSGTCSPCCGLGGRVRV